MSTSTLARIMKMALGNLCSKADHAEAIISYETERRYSLAQAAKCRKRGDDCGYGKWMDQARRYTTESMKETSKAGIVGNSAYANGLNSDIIARMN